VRAVDAESGELGRCVSLADRKHQAAAGDQVDHGGVLGDAKRVVQRQDQDVGADADVAGTGGDGGGRHERRGQHPVVCEVVLGQPHHVVAEPVGFSGLGQALCVVLRGGGRIAAGPAEVVHDAESRQRRLVEDHAGTQPGRRASV
jgi:hypothetical protein